MNMELTEKYRPQKYADFIGDPKLLPLLEEYVFNEIPVILVGKPGIGKTTSVYLVAKKLGYRVIETNASDKRTKEDLQDLEKSLVGKSLEKVVFLIEEIDGMQKDQKYLVDIIKKSNHPVVLTANDTMKVSLKLKKNCKLVLVTITNRYLQAICDRMKYIGEQEGLKPNFLGVSFDIRGSINTVFEGSQGYDVESSDWDKISNIFKTKKIERIKNNRGKDTTLYWVLDNIPNFYFGLDVYKAIKILEIVTKTGNIDLLKCLPTTNKGTVKYPYFLRKRSKNGFN